MSMDGEKCVKIEAQTTDEMRYIAKVRGFKSLSIDGSQKAEGSRDWSKRAQKLEQKGVRIGALIWER